MSAIGSAVQQVGVVLLAGGFTLYFVTIIYRLAHIFRVLRFQSQAFVIGFYARAAATLGAVLALTGSIIAGTTPWPWLIAVFIFGAPSLALLLVRPVTPDQFRIGRFPDKKP